MLRKNPGMGLGGVGQRWDLHVTSESRNEGRFETSQVQIWQSPVASVCSSKAGPQCRPGWGAGWAGFCGLRRNTCGEGADFSLVSWQLDKLDLSDSVNL